MGVELSVDVFIGWISLPNSPEMSLTVSTRGEGKVTVQTLVRTGSTVCTYMADQRALVCARVHTQVTLVRGVA